jgi:hypothetical protein
MASRLQIIESAMDDFISYDLAFRVYMRAVVDWVDEVKDQANAEATADIHHALDQLMPKKHLPEMILLRLQQLGHVEGFEQYQDYYRRTVLFTKTAQGLRPPLTVVLVDNMNFAREGMRRYSLGLSATFDGMVAKEGGPPDSYDAKFAAEIRKIGLKPNPEPEHRRVYEERFPQFWRETLDKGTAQRES